MLVLIFGIRHSVAWTNRHLSTILVLCRVLNALKILCAVHIHLFKPLAISDLFTVFFWFCHFHIITVLKSYNVYVAFQIGFFPFSIYVSSQSFPGLLVNFFLTLDIFHCLDVTQCVYLKADSTLQCCKSIRTAIKLIFLKYF